MEMPISLQLWTVKDVLEKDFFGTLEKIAKMGYDGVEFAGYYGYSAKEVKEKLDQLGIVSSGSHIQKELIFNQLEEVIAFEKELGNDYIICPYANFDTYEEWVELADKLSMARRKVSSAGLRLVYHNHDNEFVMQDNQYILDMILNPSPEDPLDLELDTYWSEYANVDTIAYMNKYKGRLPLVHIKDMASSKTESTEVGNGILDIKSFVISAKENGAQWLVVEQEAFQRPTLESAKISLSNLKDIIRKI